MTDTTVHAVTPDRAFQILSSDADSVLIDVRTRAEWSFVGVPDLSAIGKNVIGIEWVSFPSMTPNDAFVDEVALNLPETGETPPHLLFICRSGARSLAAAQAVLTTFADRGRTVTCTNVAEGFEGDLNEVGHRGTVNGWKVHGLAWRQN